MKAITSKSNRMPTTFNICELAAPELSFNYKTIINGIGEVKQQ
jgi:hypothetical protein